jgi:urate oxidase
MIELGPNRYGKESIRLVKVSRDGGRHTVRDLTVNVALEGDFGRAFTDDDNSAVLATDTMKNTVYAFAVDRLAGSIESFALAVARHLAAVEHVRRAEVTIDEHTWAPIAGPSSSERTAFVRDGRFVRTASVAIGPDGEEVGGGFRDLAVMKTAGSAFVGFPRDRFTTLAETTDRIMATLVSASWRYRGDPDALDHDALFEAVSGTFLDAFADHQSASVQASIWIIGRAVLERHAELDEIRLVMPNLHHWAVDLTPFGLENANEVFVATREPHGLIEAVVRRSEL